MAENIYVCPKCGSNEVSDRKTKYNGIGWAFVIFGIIGASILLPILLIPVGLSFVGYAFFIPQKRRLLCRECNFRFSKEEADGVIVTDTSN